MFYAMLLWQEAFLKQCKAKHNIILLKESQNEKYANM